MMTLYTPPPVNLFPLLLFGTPLHSTRPRLPGQVRKRCSTSGEVSHEPPVPAYQTQERPHVLLGLRLGTILDGLHLLFLGLDQTPAQHIAKVPDLGFDKVALFWMDCQSCLLD